ncbi:MAG: hypothetical protein IKJ98_02265 [Bacteroidales bacterium]|nr:hypothetical protein [Bacteroidales bacterium]MBR3979966.1 hypothetical protein [Bacteroidales bacterium]
MKLTGIIESVFGGRYLFRGFATISNLVKYSTANYTYQRTLDNKRIEKIIEYLRNDKFRFFSELLFGLELDDPHAILQLNKQTIPGGIKFTDNIKLVKSKFTFQNTIGENPTTKVISLEFDDNNATKLSRIDGNHRLSAIEKVFESEDDILKQELGNLIVPFSILIQQKNVDSNKFESAIFYTINAKAQPLTEEENLRSLLKKDLFSREELKSIFDVDIQIDVIKNTIEHLPIDILPNLGEEFSKCYYSCLFKVAKLCAVHDIIINHSSLISAFKAVEIEFTNNDELIKWNNNTNLICAFVFYYCKGITIYRAFKQWVSSNRVYRLIDIQIDSIIELFDESQNTQIKVFVAMPYYSDEILRSTNNIYSRVIRNIRDKYNIDISLPGDIMTYKGSTVNIVNDVLNRIRNCDICFCDITDNNPNVTYEMGWARALNKYVVILKEEDAEKPKSDYLLDFYSTYKKDAYITLEEAVDKNIKAILKKHYSVPIED